MKDKPATKQTLFESMEPRLLFSGGLESMLATDVLTPSAAVLNTPQQEQTETDTLVAGDTRVQEEARQELVVIDTSVPDYQVLANSLLADSTRSIDLLYFDSTRDGIEQLSDILSGYRNLDALHIISHGSQTGLQLGNATLQADTLAQYTPAISEWNSAFSAGADLLLYGCNLAGSEAGVALIGALEELTGADVAASDDLTGSRTLGGDWELEYHLGEIETSIAYSNGLQGDWTGVLATTTAGTEFQVNSTTADNQQNSVVATDAGGNFVVVWESNNQDGDGSGIYAQRYDAAGNTVGSEFRVNTTTTDNQTAPAVAMNADGDFVVVWVSNNQDGGGSGIYAQRYDATGNSVGIEFLVNTTTADNQTDPDVAMAADGNFVVVWASSNQDGDKTGIYGQRYNTAGNTVGTEFQVNLYSVNKQEHPSVAMDTAGRYVISWDSLSQDGSSWGTFARLYDNTGTAQTGDIQVNATTNGVQQYSDVAMDADGDFVVAWEGNGTGDNAGVFARLYDNTGTAKGGEFLVNTTTANTQGNAAVAMDADGSFVVVWTSNNQDGDTAGIYGQQYDAAGSTIGSEFLVNTNTLYKQENPGIALYGLDEFIVVWQSNHLDAGSTWDVYGQRYTSINVDPVIDLPGGPVNYTENAAPVVIDAGATATDPDSADFDGGTLTVDLSAGGMLDDRLLIRNEGTAPGQIGISGSDVTYGGLVIGTFTGGNDGMTPLVITLNVSADLAAVQALMRNISFQNVSENPNTGNRTVRFVLTDGDGGTSNTASETITVTAVNDAPVANDLALNATEDGAPVTGSFSVSDPDATDTHSFTLTGAPAEGSVINSGDGTFTFDPGTDFQDLALGETRDVSFTYTATDDSGAASDTSNTATVTVTVTGTNDAPVASDLALNATEDGTPVTGSFSVSDPDATDTHSFTLTGAPAEGSVINNGDGTFTFDPGTDFQDLALGETRDVSFTYTATDDSGAASDTSNTATVTITVTGANDAPVVSDDGPAVVDEGQSININLTGNDTDVDGAIDPGSIVITSGPAFGSLTINADGSVDYTHDGTENFLDSFSYTIKDTSGAESGTATVTINVIPANDPAVAADDAYNADEDTALNVADAGKVLNNDTDPENDPLTAVLISGPADGNLTLNPDGTFTYVPDADFNGTDSFTYQAFDGTGFSNVATVTISINPVNDAPAANNDDYSLTEDNILGTGAPGVLSNDLDVDGDPLIATLVNGPGQGTLTLNSDGSFTYTPDAGFTGTDSFIYMANDGNGGTATATVTLTVNPLVAPPPDPDIDPGDDLPDGDIDSGENLPSGITGITGSRFPYLTSEEDRMPEFSAGTPEYDSMHAALDRDGNERQSDKNPGRQGLLSAMKLFSSANFGLWQMIDLMKDQMGDRQGGNQNFLELLAKSATGMTLTLSAGIVTWALRGGSVLASMLSSMPLWKGFDPLPIIDSARKEREGRAKGNDADEANQSERVAEELLDAVEHSAQERDHGMGKP